MPKGVKITDNTNKFISRHEQAQDTALKNMALKVIRLSSRQVPVDQGTLKSSKGGSPHKQGKLKYAVIYNSRYAAYQEFGGDSRRTVRRYTTPGTKKHYLTDPGKLVGSKAGEFFKVASANIKL